MKALLYGMFLTMVGVGALAQGAQVPFVGLQEESSTVEITSESLGIDQNTGKAVFSGNVVVGMNEMRLAADKVEIIYSTDSIAGSGPISSIIASGNVIFTNGLEAAEANFADIDLDAGEIVMTGDVILTQGKNALSGQTLHVDLNSGTALIEGGVQTILQTGALGE